MLRAMLIARGLFGSLICLSALSLCACAYGEVRQVVRAQFASELHCPEVQVKKRDVWYSYGSPNQFKVSGCGTVRTYTCPADNMVSYDEPACTFVEGDADAPQINTPPSIDEGADAMDAPIEEAPAPVETKPTPKKAPPKGKARGGMKLGGGVKLDVPKK